jgi:hypothetical protein
MAGQAATVQAEALVAPAVGPGAAVVAQAEAVAADGRLTRK